MSQLHNSPRRRTPVRRLSGYLTVLAALLLTMIAPLSEAQVLTGIFANRQTIRNSWNGNVTQSGASVTISKQSAQSWQAIPPKEVTQDSASTEPE
jgi:hypothetical protein